MLARLIVNPDAGVREEIISEHHTCVVIDDFLQNPEAVVSYAATCGDDFEVPQRSYPGMVMDIDADPMAEIYRFLRTRMSRFFDFFRSGVKMSTILSMTTLRPHELSNLQRICHVDPGSGIDRRNFASVLYLFENPLLGGTAFYRWKDRKAVEEATALDLEDSQTALQFLKSKFDYYNEAPRYFTTSNEVAELLAMVPAKFNRLIFYSGDLPHNAWIDRPDLLSTNPETGRLTLNCFLSVKPRPDQ